MDRDIEIEIEIDLRLYIYIYIYSGNRPRDEFIRADALQQHGDAPRLLRTLARRRGRPSPRYFPCARVNPCASCMGHRQSTPPWPLHDIAITNVVWCMTYTKEGRGGVVYCAIDVQWYCNSAGSAGGRGKYTYD